MKNEIYGLSRVAGRYQNIGRYLGIARRLSQMKAVPWMVEIQTIHSTRSSVNWPIDFK